MINTKGSPLPHTEDNFPLKRFSHWITYYFPNLKHLCLETCHVKLKNELDVFCDFAFKNLKLNYTVQLQ